MGKLTDYGLPIVGALVLHAVVVAMLEWEWAPSSPESVVVQPKAITAMLIVREPRSSATTEKPLPTNEQETHVDATEDSVGSKSHVW